MSQEVQGFENVEQVKLWSFSLNSWAYSCSHLLHMSAHLSLVYYSFWKYCSVRFSFSKTSCRFKEHTLFLTQFQWLNTSWMSDEMFSNDVSPIRFSVCLFVCVFSLRKQILNGHMSLHMPLCLLIMPKPNNKRLKLGRKQSYDVSMDQHQLYYIVCIIINA